jgi:RDD family
MRSYKKFILIYTSFMAINSLFEVVVNNFLQNNYKEAFDVCHYWIDTSILGYFFRLLPHAPLAISLPIDMIISNVFLLDSTTERLFISSLIFLCLLWGIYKFHVKGKSKVLTLILMISFCSYFYYFIQFILSKLLTSYLADYKQEYYQQISTFEHFFSLIIHIIHAVLLYKFVKFLIGTVTLKLEGEYLVESPQNLRFWNRFLDALFIIFFGWGILDVLYDSSFFSQNTLILINSTCTFLYYLLFESFFQTTPGKFINGNMVVVDDGSKPPFLRILGRTLCRFIPLEPVLFYFGNRLHDTVSKTGVYEVES